jgi:hypothetical protein
MLSSCTMRDRVRSGKLASQNRKKIRPPSGGFLTGIGRRARRADASEEGECWIEAPARDIRCKLSRRRRLAFCLASPAQLVAASLSPVSCPTPRAPELFRNTRFGTDFRPGLSQCKGIRVPSHAGTGEFMGPNPAGQFSTRRKKAVIVPILPPMSMTGPSTSTKRTASSARRWRQRAVDVTAHFVQAEPV